MAKAKTPPGFNTPFANLPPPRASAPAKPAAPAGKPQTAASAKVPAKASAPVANKAVTKQVAESKLSDDDIRAFEQAMSGVTPLSGQQRRARTSTLVDRPPPGRRRSLAASDDALARADLADLVQKHDLFTVEEVGEAVTGLAPGIDRKLLVRLRDGDYPVEAELDLHHRSRAEAAGLLDRFLARARADRLRCVLVIHGRGLNSGADGPVLATATREWLSQSALRRHVLAFTSAPPPLGGTGATLVLLRRSEP